MRKFTLFLCFSLLLAVSTRAQVVINEVYGGGGNSGAPFQNDFIELYNNGSTAVDLTGWTVQYASSSGSSWQKTELTGVIPAHGYFLIMEAAGATASNPLPAADVTGTISMSASSGKLALVDNNTSLTGTCPTAIDLVGFGSANCFEGTGATGGLSNQSSAQRTVAGGDTNDNSSDFTVSAPTPQNSTKIVINEVYGGGGNSGAPYTNDFIELFNAGNIPVDLTGWSVQYGSSTGTSWQVTALSGMLPAQTHYLIQEAAGSNTAATPLPTADVIGTISMSSSNGKVALVNSTTALSGCATGDPSLIDLVGFGSASCFEGTGATASISNTSSAQRTPEGLDTDNNATDFTTGAPSPMNSGITAAKTLTVSLRSDAAEPATPGIIDIDLSEQSPSGGIYLEYQLSGTATLNADYTDSSSSSGQIYIPQGQMGTFIGFDVVDDNLAEGDETIIFTIVSASADYSIANAEATITIHDDEVAPVGPIQLGTAAYTQDFNSLANSGSSSLLPNGWSLAESGNNADDTYAAGTGSSNSGNSYSFGSDGSKERALGGLLSGSLTPSFGAVFSNATGTSIDRLKISFTGEQWRLGTTGRSDELQFSYSLNATDYSDGSGTWISVPQLAFASPSTTVTGALNGNDAANQTALSYIIAGLSIPAGAEFRIRWTDINSAGADDGLAIDDLSVEANPFDGTAPVATAFSPALNATDVPLSITATLSFNEAIAKGSGNIYIKQLSDDAVFTTLNIADAAVAVNGQTVSFPISGMNVSTGYYIEIEAGAIQDLSNNAFAGINGNSGWQFTTGTAIAYASFDNCTSSGMLDNGYTQFSVAGAQIWACSSFGRDASNLPSGSAPYGVQMNGYDNGIASNVLNEDWLISPAYDISGTTYPLLSFWSRTRFNGAPLQLKVSTNYTGADPATATWTDLNGKFPNITSDVWTLSENINLSAHKGSNVHIAFVYSSSDEDGARWTLDDIRIDNSATPPPPSLTISSSSLQFGFTPSGTSSVKAFTVTGNDLTGPITLNSSSRFSLSLDSAVFSSSVSITKSDVPVRVLVRFTPDQAGQDYEGTILLSSTGIPSADTIDLKGSSLDPANTLEVVNWNMEWFGSPTLGPSNDDQQQANAATILQSIAADLYAVVEVVDESRLAAIVNNMPGYSYVICDFGSHTNPFESGASSLADAQKEAFVYKTEMFSNISTSALVTDGVNTAADLSNPAYNYFSSGRYPYMMTADVTLNGVKKNIRFVLLHAKANTSPTNISYQRRENGSDTLHYTFEQMFPNENIILLGDLNDDLDQSITDGFTETSYHAFTSDTINFFSPTLALSLEGKKSTVSYNDVIDHVILSNEAENLYVAGSAAILTDVAQLVTNYGSTTSDHYPVFTRYRFDLGDQPMPEVLESFNARKAGVVALLDWTAKKNSAVKNFAVERSSDAVYFVRIGTVRGLPNAPRSHIYHYTDINPLNGINYYRLRIEYLDGTVEYSSTRTVDMGGFVLFKAFPNPASGSVFVTYVGREKATLSFLNMQGQVMKQTTLQAGFKLQQLSLSGLTPGLYVLRVDDGTKSENFKLIVR